MNYQDETTKCIFVIVFFLKVYQRIMSFNDDIRKMQPNKTRPPTRYGSHIFERKHHPAEVANCVMTRWRSCKEGESRGASIFVCVTLSLSLAQVWESQLGAAGCLLLLRCSWHQL